MNKRQKKKGLLWWSSLDIQERDEYFKIVCPKSKSRYDNPTELEKLKMYSWSIK